MSQEPNEDQLSGGVDLQSGAGVIAGPNCGQAHRSAWSTEAKGWAFAAALILAVVLCYQPAWHGGFIFDDDIHLLDNPVLKPGGLAKVWTSSGNAGYRPVTFTVYWLQWLIWGVDPVGFHLVNIAVHAVSALLVWRVLVRLGMPGAMFAAAIFALHPVNVESVAWISQLKGLLSLLLALVSVLLLLAHERLGGWWRLALASGAFLLATLSKGTVITLPIVLLACTWWQRGRIGWRDLLRILPYLLIGTIMAGTEVLIQHLMSGGDTPVRSDGFGSRFAVAGCAVWFYLGKLIWPLDLCLIYPRWRIDGRDVLSYLPGVLLAFILGLAWWRRRTWGRPIVMLIVCYVGLLLPTLGFVNITFMVYSLVADHYQYAAMIVPSAMLAAALVTLGRRQGGMPLGGAAASRHVSQQRTGLPDALHRESMPLLNQPLRETLRYVLCLGLLATLAGLTWRQSRLYADAETIYRATIDRNPDCWLAHNNLGMALLGRGQVDEAIGHYRQALEIKPDYVLALNNLGVALFGRGQVDEAIALYRRALEIKPDYAEAHYNLGNALFGRGEVNEAIAHYRKALEIGLDRADVHRSLGNALFGRGEVDEAIAHYRKALAIKPDYAETHYNLGTVLAGRGEADEAIGHYRRALEIKPDYAEAHYNLGNMLAGRGEVDEAIAHFRRALEIKSEYPDADNNLGSALAGRGRFDEAIAHYRRALAIKPDYAEAHYNLGNMLAGRGEVDEAIAHYRRALEIKPDHADAHCDLANVLASRGQFDEAIAHFRRALEIKPDFVKAHDNLGTVLAGRGEIDEAITHYRRALEIKPDSLEVHYNLGTALAGRGQVGEALEHYQKALELATARNDKALADMIRAQIKLHPSVTPGGSAP